MSEAVTTRDVQSDEFVDFCVVATHTHTHISKYIDEVQTCFFVVLRSELQTPWIPLVIKIHKST